MNIYFKGVNRKKGNQSSVPNLLAFNVIREFLKNDEFEDLRKMYYIRKLNSSEASQAMKDIKWLFRKYKGLEVIKVKHKNGNITKVKL